MALTEELLEQLQTSIEQNLPKQVGETLQKRLADADSFERNLELRLKEIKTLKEANAKLEKELAAHNALTVREKELKAFKEAVDEQQKNLDLWYLQRQLELSEKYASQIESYTGLLVRNTVFKKSVMNSRHIDPSHYNSVSGEYEVRDTGFDEQTTIEEE